VDGFVAQEITLVRSMLPVARPGGNGTERRAGMQAWRDDIAARSCSMRIQVWWIHPDDS
jgi:hypothetical protein